MEDYNQNETATISLERYDELRMRERQLLLLEQEKANWHYKLEAIGYVYLYHAGEPVIMKKEEWEKSDDYKKFHGIK